MEAAELLGVEVDDFLIVGLDDELEVDDDHKVDGPAMVKDLSLECDQCNFKTADKWQLKIHIAAKHIGIMYGCDECQHQSAYKKNLKRHKRRAHKPSFPNNWGEKKEEDEWNEGETEIKERGEYMEIERKEESEFNERNQGDEDNLVLLGLGIPLKKTNPEAKPKRLNVQNTQMVSYKCDQCIFKTFDKYHLKKHITAKHTGIRYDCGECDYQSAYKKSIKRHKLGAHKNYC